VTVFMTPRIVHLMHFPWDRDHKLKADENDFDHAPVAALRAFAPDFEVRLWTVSKARDFCRQFHPEIWAALENAARPVMWIDVLRWAVVHQFGGIYWQMNATPLKRMDAYLPTPGKSVRLFTEFELSPEACRALAAEPIRRGEPEEPTRVLIQAFAAEPGAAFVRKTLAFLLERMRTCAPRRDYDVLYVTGNAAVSTAYDRFGRNDAGVERIGLEESRRMLKWHYRGSWRTEAPPPAPPPRPPSAAPKWDRFPGLAAVYYRCFRAHAHEVLLEELGDRRPVGGCVSVLRSWIAATGVRRTYEAPSGLVKAPEISGAYVGADPRRAVVRENRRQEMRAGIHFKWANLLYTRFPHVDLFICPDFLEWLSHAEALRVLRRIRATSRPRHLALTSYRWLNDSWDAASGDFRPIAFQREPFGFPTPVEVANLEPWGDGRPDRCLMVWEMRQLHLG